ncbi:CBS domain-containing protein [[Mycobacterium] burgundiense]|uniref:CBS domain-containing protein n=1 Tax=[Mycobacterium] burgundiense TaxID=3064286 RepID=A0ABM9LX17_9MYCO|nr:CBS domain-containing protein [Mycolicibacterium sp. MU0053]CAJ1506198.1 CBS domain-containing protein [Mycolicibacterium sp. MU0053]
MTSIPAAGSILIADITGDSVVRIPADASVLEAAEALVANGVGVVVIGDEQRPTALISERDVARAVAAGRDFASTPAVEIASTTLLWCAADTTVEQAALRMTDKYIRHLLVEDAGKLVSIVSARDLLGVYASEAVRADFA